MSSASRLKYRVVKCTSEDPEFPVSELLAHSSQTRGWQTARFCDFPQEIGIQFDTPVHLSQVQFLSHEQKIAAKIELFTALTPSGAGVGAQRYEDSQFKRLGYLSLDNNERSNFRARELKSVYVDVRVQFLKIWFHKCHKNRYNDVDQVGLIALNCLGQPWAPQQALVPPVPPPAPPVLSAMTPISSSGTGAAGSRPRKGLHAVEPLEPKKSPSSVASSAQDCTATRNKEQGLDQWTVNQMRKLETAKQRAVENEDYEEAKRCKEIMSRLGQLGQQLRELEERKTLAVQNEDYDTAKSLKTEIDRLRASLENPGAVNLQGAQPPVMVQAPPTIEPPHGGSDSGTEAAKAVPTRGTRAVRGAAEQQGQRRGAEQRQPAASPRQPQAEELGQREIPSMAGGPGFDGGGQLPPLPRYGGDPAPGRMASIAAENSSIPDACAVTQQASLEGHPLAGVPNVENLDQPEELNEKFESQAAELRPLFGEYVPQCLFSKAWQLRDAALQKLALDLREGVRAGLDPGQLLRGYTAVLRHVMPDKNVQVFSSGVSLLQVVSRHLLERGPFRRQSPQSPEPLLSSGLEPLLQALADRLGDANARADKTARDAHMELARCKSVGAPFASQYLLRQPKKANARQPPRIYTSRLQLLAALVAEVGIQPESREGLPLDPTIQLAMDCFQNNDADVRKSAVRLVGACFAYVGLGKIEPYLASLRQAQREVFDSEFERVSSGAGGVGAGGRAGPVRSPAAAKEFGDGGVPAPQAPLRRSAGAGAGAAAPAAAPAATLAAPRPEQPQLKQSVAYGGASGPAEEDAEEEFEEEFTCQFCGRRDDRFTPENLDLHYWRECPMLTQCQLCQQVIEIAKVYSHLCEECEAEEKASLAARALQPNQCPLCHADVGAAEEKDWLQHVLHDGCPLNPRRLRDAARR